MLFARVARPTFMVAMAAIVSCGGGSETSASVTPPPTTGTPHVDRVVLNVFAASLFVGGTTQLTATAVDAAGSTLSGRAVTWTSLAPALASVSSDGTVTATGGSGFGTSTQATAIITATIEGKSASATIAVTAPGPPAITSLMVTPSIIVQGASRVPVTVSAHMLSPGSGVRSASVTFYPPLPPGNEAIYTQRCDLRLSSGTPSDGQWSCVISWPDELPGRYELYSIGVENGPGAQNVVWYYDEGSRALGFTTGLTVVPTAADTTAPALIDFAVLPTSSPVATAKSVTFAARTTDAGAGVDRISIDLGEPTGDVGLGNFPTCTTTAATSDRRDVSWTCSPFLFPLNRTGAYPIRSVMVSDRLGNSRIYTNPQLLAAGFSAVFTVVP